MLSSEYVTGWGTIWSIDINLVFNDIWSYIVVSFLSFQKDRSCSLVFMIESNYFKIKQLERMRSIILKLSRLYFIIWSIVSE